MQPHTCAPITLCRDSFVSAGVASAKGLKATSPWIKPPSESLPALELYRTKRYSLSTTSSAAPSKWRRSSSTTTSRPQRP